MNTNPTNMAPKSEDNTAQASSTATMASSTVTAPIFSAAPLSSQAQQAINSRGTPATLNLDDIFGDCFFTPEGDTVFLSEQEDPNNSAIQVSGEPNIVNVASRPMAANGTGQQQFVPVAQAGGIATTGLSSGNGVRATTMGPATAGVGAVTQNPIAAPPQQRHHLQFATTLPSSAMTGTKKRGGASARERKMSDQQKSERRERNREHAKRSRIRKKILLESLQQSVSLLKEENDKLRGSIRQHLGDPVADELLTEENLANTNVNSLIASNSKDANKVLDDPDFSFIKALQTAQQNFVVTDPSLPDNPIVYATQGFLNLTGYALDQVLGRNCRFLQGPETDPKAVEKIRRSIEEGSDMSVCLLNYRVDGTTFWNQFFISALRDAAGNITNYVGVQCKVSDQYAANVCKRQEEEFANVDTEVENTTGGAVNVGVGAHDNSHNAVSAISTNPTPTNVASAAPVNTGEAVIGTGNAAPVGDAIMQ